MLQKFTSFFREALPALITLLSAAGFLFAERVPDVDAVAKDLLLLLPAAYLVAIVVVGTGLTDHTKTSTAASLRLALTPALLVLGAYGHFVLVGGAAARYLILVSVHVMLFVYLRQVSRLQEWAARDAAFGNLSYATHVLTAFFLSGFAFGLVGLLQMPIWIVGSSVGIVMGALTAETLRRFGVQRGIREVAVVYAVLGLMIFVAMSALPVSFSVSAAVYAIGAALALYVASRGMPAQDPLPRLRRYVLISAILTAALFITARWI